uniref:Uncharacterized protein n=1 Tax=Moniliophthora roreri TaxID=221103 RepID=A0A0W0FFV7_MONRR
MPVSLFFSDEQCMGVPIRFAAAPAAPYGKEQVVHSMLDYSLFFADQQCTGSDVSDNACLCSSPTNSVWVFQSASPPPHTLLAKSRWYTECWITVLLRRSVYRVKPQEMWVTMPVSLFFSDEQCIGSHISFVGEEQVVHRMLDYRSSPTISVQG